MNSIITSDWCVCDTWGAIKARTLNSFRDNYRVTPGLYELGSPTGDSPVVVTANYRLTFNHVRRALKGRSAWILVLDTNGINVWCAAGKGSFGTAELLKQIMLTDLHSKVNHRTLILPQLGASNMKAHEIAKKSGFSVRYGPVQVNDLPKYLDDGFVATEAMRTIQFPLVERVVLAPMELSLSVTKILWASLALLILSGLSRHGVLFADAFRMGMPWVAAVLTGWFTGAFLAPVLLPWLPFRSFALKGFFLALPMTALLIGLQKQTGLTFSWLLLFELVTVPALASFMALNFTGASTFTSPSGVKKEMKRAIPLYVGAALVALFAVIVQAISHL